MRTIAVIGPSAWLADRKTAAQRSVNWYPMLVESPAEDAEMVLESAPGLSLVHTFASDIRGMHNADGRLFVVAGSTLYEVLSDDSVVSRGTVMVGTGRVQMVNGTGQIAMVNGAHLWVFNLGTNALAEVTTAWIGSNVVDFLNGYFIFADPDSERFFVSAIDDAATLDALDFSSADEQPDNIVSLAVIRGELYLLGERSTEVWIDSGGQDFPFARYQGTPIAVGIVGPYALCKAADSLVWVGQSGNGGPYVYTMNGYQPVRISTQSVEQQLAQSTALEETALWTYQDAGGEFVCIHSPGMGTAWVWDAATKLWHERGELEDGLWVPTRVEFTAYRNGTHYAAGATKLYKMSRDYHDLAGDALVRERTWPHLVGPDFEAMQFHSLELRCTTGEEPEGSIMLEVSNDGGAVWSAPLRRTLGATGRRQQRVRWMPLGTCPAGGSRVFRLRCSDAVPLTIQGAAIK